MSPGSLRSFSSGKLIMQQKGGCGIVIYIKRLYKHISNTDSRIPCDKLYIKIAIEWSLISPISKMFKALYSRSVCVSGELHRLYKQLSSEIYAVYENELEAAECHVIYE